MDLTNEDVTDILALLDSLPYDELDLQTSRFRLTLRRTPDGWTQAVESRGQPTVLDVTPAPAAPVDPVDPPGGALPTPPEATPDGSSGVRGIQAPPIGAGGTHAPVGDGETADDQGRRDTQAPPTGAGGTHAPVGEGEAGREPVAGREPAAGRELVAVRAPLPGTFYRAPRPGAAPFVEVGTRVGAETVVGIVETMKLMNSVSAGVDGTVTEICVADAEFAPHGTTLLRIRAD